MGSDRVLEEFKLAGLKREKVRKSFEQAHDKASDILSFTVQWRDLENHYDLVESVLEKRSREVELKEKELGAKSLALEERALRIEAAEAETRDLEMKADGFRREVEAKQKELDFLRNQVETCACDFKSEEKRLTEIKTLVRGCEVDLCSKNKQLILMQKSLEGTRGELEFSEKQLRQTKAELVKCLNEVDTEKENLGKIQNDARQCKEECDRTMKDLTLVLETRARCDQQLALVEEQLDSRHKLLELRSLELNSREKELDVVRESIRSCDSDLDLKRKEVQSLENSIREFCEHLESKNAELGGIQKLIGEQTHELEVKLKRRDSVAELIRINIEELATKEKKQEEMSEALRKYSSEIEYKENKLARTEETIKTLSKKLYLKGKHLDSTQRHLQRCTTKLELKQNNLDVLNESLRKSSEDLESKQRNLNSLQLHITDYHKQIEASEKKVQDLESLVEESSRKLQVKQEMLTSVERSMKILTDELATKEHDLTSVKMKLEETVKENESKNEHYKRLEVSLKERGEELELKEKQFDALVKNFELKEQQLESERKKFSKCIDEFEQKVEKVSKFCLQSKTDQWDNLLRNLNPKDEKSLMLLLNGCMKKCSQLHVEVSDALKASSDPARLALDMIQQFYSTRLKMKETEFDQDVVSKNCICLLECLMDISPEIKPGVQAEAIKLATNFKNKMQVKAENVVEVLGMLHFLVAFSLVYGFGTSELQSLFDVITLRKYAPSLGKALGLSTLASLSDDDKIGQPLGLDIPINSNATPSLPLDIQPNEAVSELVCALPPREDALMDSEVSAVLRSSPDPAKFVLDRMQEAIQKQETRFEESVVNYCILLLEELMKVSRRITPQVRFEASKLAIQWKGKLQTGNPTSLEILGFLLLLAAFNMVDTFDRREISCLAYSVAFYKNSPELFQSLGLSDVIVDFVLELVRREHYIPAVRLICWFKLYSTLSPKPLLRKEIEYLKQSSTDSQVERKDIEKMRAILEIIADYKLQMDLPGDLVARFMFQMGNQRQRAIFSTPAAQMQLPYADISTLDASHPTSVGALSHPRAVGAFESEASRSQMENQVGVKRVRAETMAGRHLGRACVKSRSRFHPSGNDRC